MERVYLAPDSFAEELVFASAVALVAEVAEVALGAVEPLVQLIFLAFVKALAFELEAFVVETFVAAVAFVSYSFRVAFQLLVKVALILEFVVALKQNHQQVHRLRPVAFGLAFVFFVAFPASFVRLEEETCVTSLS